MIRLPFAPLAAAAVAVGEVAYLACVAAGVLWPNAFDAETFLPKVLPGFAWLDPVSFVIGLVDVAIYGVVAAAVGWIAWNFVVDRAVRAA
ncbi:MAG TPA: hypothetical protein VNI78_09775 [Vicinamibacterales bacterium]|nr:hypothetical protein [Vicinamibacterales bacterium]